MSDGPAFLLRTIARLTRENRQLRNDVRKLRQQRLSWKERAIGAERALNARPTPDEVIRAARGKAARFGTGCFGTEHHPQPDPGIGSDETLRRTP